MGYNGSFNVDDIMKDIRKKIKDENLAAAELSFEDVPLGGMPLKYAFSKDVLQRNTEYVSAAARIEPNKPIGGNSLKSFVKKVIRKLVQFYIVPIVDEQNNLNANYTSAIQQINGFIQKTASDEDVTLSAKVEELELRQLYNSREIELLHEQIDCLKKELAQLREGKRK